MRLVESKVELKSANSPARSDKKQGGREIRVKDIKKLQKKIEIIIIKKACQFIQVCSINLAGLMLI